MSRVHSDIVVMLDTAISLVSPLPEHLQAAALGFVLSQLAGQSAGGRPNSRPLDGISDEDVARRGDRVQKAIHAVAQLNARGEDATLSAVTNFLRDELASTISKPADVLKSATPKYLSRKRVDGQYVYSVTVVGLDYLRTLRKGE